MVEGAGLREIESVSLRGREEVEVRAVFIITNSSRELARGFENGKGESREYLRGWMIVIMW